MYISFNYLYEKAIYKKQISQCNATREKMKLKRSNFSSSRLFWRVLFDYFLIFRLKTTYIFSGRKIKQKTFTHTHKFDQSDIYIYIKVKIKYIYILKK